MERRPRLHSEVHHRPHYQQETEIEEKPTADTLGNVERKVSVVSDSFEDSFFDNGSSFGYYQLWWFVLSVIGLTLYFLHYMGSLFVHIYHPHVENTHYTFPLLHRTTADALLEVIICTKLILE